jgi:TolC family type I secretion outer membrane protein
MLRLFAACIICGLSVPFDAGFAGPLSAADAPFAVALAQAYSSNPQLLEQRQRLRQTDEGVPRALSGWRPRVTLEGSLGASAVFDRADTAHQPERRVPAVAELALTQPLYTGGRVSAEVGQAEALVKAQRAALQATEAEVLLEAATAYLDVARDQKVVELNRNESEILTRTLRASEQETDAGALTEADTAQARARLANQRAVLAASIATLNTAQAAFEQAVGERPGSLVMPSADIDLPKDLDGALARLPNNFDVVQSRAAREASLQGVDIARAGLRPRVSFEIYGARVSETDVQLAHQRDNVAEASLQVVIPIYQGGDDAAQIRQAKEAASVSLLQIDVVERRARQQVQTAWAQLTGARDRLAEYRTSLDANSVAARGIARQQSVGARTLIEVLNADQEKLGAEVNLVTARHDVLVASLRVVAATGALSASSLGLAVALYDPAQHYDETRGRWSGTDPAP